MTQAPIRLSLFGLINTYLVPERDGLSLIDTALPPLAPRILGAARQLGQPIRRILLTHGHSDHAGGLDAVLQAFPDAELWMHPADEHYLGELGLRARPTHALHGGEQVGSLRVLATAGHSLGHLAFLDGRDGTLYAGDTFTSLGRLRVVTELNPWLPMPTFGTPDPAQARQSAARLAELPHLNWLALGHGRPISQPQKAMRGAVARAQLVQPPAAWELAVARRIDALVQPSKVRGSRPA